MVATLLGTEDFIVDVERTKGFPFSLSSPNFNVGLMIGLNSCVVLGMDIVKVSLFALIIVGSLLGMWTCYEHFMVGAVRPKSFPTSIIWCMMCPLTKLIIKHYLSD
jgi:hypothetical protein